MLENSDFRLRFFQSSTTERLPSDALLQIKSASDGNLSVVELWKNRNLKSEFSNIVARDGFLYGLDDGILACLDIANGQRRWKDGRYGHGQLLLINDLLLVQ